MLVPFLIFLSFVIFPFVMIAIASFDGRKPMESSPEIEETRKRLQKSLDEKNLQRLKNILGDGSFIDKNDKIINYKRDNG